MTGTAASRGGGRRALSLALLLLVALAPAQDGTTPPPPATETPAPTSPAPETPAPASPANESPAPTAPAPGSAAPGNDAPAEAEPDLTNRPTIILERKTDEGEVKKITIIKTGPDDAGTAFICTPGEDEPEDAPTNVVYYDTSPTGVRVTVDRNVIVGPLALIQQNPAREGEGSDGRVEVSAGTAGELDEIPENAADALTRCGVVATPKVVPGSVKVTQGKTRLAGSKLVYDEADGIARVDGPITFTREDLTGTSERIEFDVEEETTTLVGKVELKDGDRVSTAGRVEYDDTKNVAILRGTKESPAESRTPREQLKAETIRYNLDTGEVVAVSPGGGITGKFEDGEETTEPTTAPATPATPRTPGN